MRITLSKLVILALILCIVFLSGCEPPKAPWERKLKKPIIYLYPLSEQIVNVQLDLLGKLTCTYPEYGEGWQVLAWPDGSLTNLKDGEEYSYLFWEGISDYQWDMSRGFVVKGSETQEFLKNKLEYIGLTPREANDFIVYWLPILQENQYNLITFADEEYENVAQLKVTPQPDSILRVFMVYKPLTQPVAVEEQVLIPFERKGFTVVEWGGTKAE